MFRTMLTLLTILLMLLSTCFVAVRDCYQNIPPVAGVATEDPPLNSDPNVETTVCGSNLPDTASDALRAQHCQASKPDGANMEAAQISKKSAANLATAINNTVLTSPDGAKQKESMINDVNKRMMQLRKEVDEIKASLNKDENEMDVKRVS